MRAPSLSWDAMLKMTKIKLELPDMYIFFEKVTRGGISYISNRYSKAHNKYLKSYDLLSYNLMHLLMNLKNK